MATNAVVSATNVNISSNFTLPNGFPQNSTGAYAQFVLPDSTFFSGILANSCSARVLVLNTWISIYCAASAPYLLTLAHNSSAIAAALNSQQQPTVLLEIKLMNISNPPDLRVITGFSLSTFSTINGNS